MYLNCINIHIYHITSAAHIVILQVQPKCNTKTATDSPGNATAMNLAPRADASNCCRVPVSGKKLFQRSFLVRR